MVHGINLQILMQCPAVLEAILVIFSNILLVNRQPEKKSALFFKQTYWDDISYSLNAIYKTTCAFDADETRLASKTLIEILSISCFLVFSYF